MRRALALLVSLCLSIGLLAGSPLPAPALTAGPSVFGTGAQVGEVGGGRVLSPVTGFGKDASGRHLAYFVTSGNAQVTANFQVIDVVTGDRVFMARVPEGIDAWGLVVVGRTVTFAVNTATGARLYSWTTGTSTLKDHGSPFGRDTVWSMSAAPDGAIFVGTYPSGALWQWTGSSAVKLGVPNKGEIYARSIAADATTVYVGSLGTGRLAAYNRSTKQFSSITIPSTGTGTNEQVMGLERRGKWLTVWTQTSNNMYFYDTTTRRFSSTVITNVSSGEVSPVDPSGKYIYLQRANFGIGRLSLSDLSLVRSGYSAQPSVRDWAWIALPGANYPEPTLAAAGATGSLWAYDMSHDPTRTSISQPHSMSLTAMVVGAPSAIRSLGAGPDGKVYLGGMQNPTGLRTYDPDTNTFDEILGVPQIEAFGSQGSKLFAGGYPGGRIFVHDTSQSVTFDPRTAAADDQSQNPFFHVLSPSQERPFAFADVGNRRMAIGTVANKNTSGGALSFWRPGAPAQVIRNPVGDQSVVSLLSKGSILVAGSSIHGGTGYDPTTLRAQVFTVNPTTGAVIDRLVPSFEGKVTWINGLTTNPHDGTVWGIAGANLFQVSVDGAGKLTLLRTEPIFTGNAGWYGNDYSLQFHNGILYAAAGGDLVAINPETFAKTTLAESGITDMVKVGNALYFVKDEGSLYRWNLPASASYAPQLGSHAEGDNYVPGPTSISGVGQPGSSVTVRIDGTRVGSATVGSTGRWSLSNVDAARGTHTIALSSVISGRTSPTVSYSVNFTAALIEPPRTQPKITGMTGDHTGEGLADVYGVDGQGRLQFYAGTATGTFRYQGQVDTGWDDKTHLAQIADINGDRRSDVLARRGSDHSLWIHHGTGYGWLSSGQQAGKNWGGMDQIVPVGSLTGGSTQYVVARRASDGALFRYTLTPNGLTGIAQIGWRWNGMRQILGVGDFSGDGRGDVLAIRNDGTLWVYLGTASGTIGSGRQVGHGWNTFARAFSPGDFTGDKKFDLIGQRLDGTVYAYKNLGGRWDAARRVMSGTQDWKLMA